MVEKKDQTINMGMLILGITLLGTGTLFLASNVISYLSPARLWPLFMLIPVGVLLAVGIQYKEKLPAVIFPIIILTFYCGYFLWLNFTSWHYVAATWPNFLIGPGLGFLGLYFTSHKWEFMIPSFILLLLAASFYGAILGNTLIVGILMVAMGLALVLRGLIKGRKKEAEE
ncbi:MAG: hypothetical protein GY950_28355 [bacterium]|nr:hypothetical protein [bacterium]